MLFATIKDTQPRYAQVPNGCATACADMACRGRGFPPGLIDRHLCQLLQPERRGGANLGAIAIELRRLGIPAEHGRGSIDTAVEQARRGRLVLGVRPSVLYVGVSPAAKHAVYVAATEHALDQVPAVVASWRPSLQFTPPVEIIDPEPLAPSRHTWTIELLRLAFLGEWLLVPEPRAIRRPR